MRKIALSASVERWCCMCFCYAWFVWYCGY